MRKFIRFSLMLSFVFLLSGCAQSYNLLSRSLLFLIYQYMNNITSKILAYICRIMYLYGIKLCK